LTVELEYSSKMESLYKEVEKYLKQTGELVVIDSRFLVEFNNILQTKNWLRISDPMVYVPSLKTFY